MSWSPDLFIGELRPWPDTVHVVRGKAEEVRRYVPERTCRNISRVTDEHGQARFVCSECDAWIDSRVLWNPEYPNGESAFVKDCKLNYCPNCGARIEVSE